MPKEKRPQNTGAALAFSCGIFFLLCAWGFAYHRLYHRVVSKDPVTVQGRVIDLGGGGAGMTYEYEFGGQRFEGQEVRGNAFGKWVGAPVHVTLSKGSPEKSTTNLVSLKKRSVEFAWGAVGALLLTGVAGYFGLRHRRAASMEEEKPATRGQASTMIAFLAAFTFVMTATSIGMAQLSGEREWLRQTAAALYQPNISAGDRLQLVEDSIESRLERQRRAMPVMLAALGGSFVVLIGASLWIGVRRRHSLS